MNHFDDSLFIREPKEVVGIKRPLFDLLADNEPDLEYENPSSLYMRKEELIVSVIKEISNILNTRLPAKKDDYKNLQKDPLNFGLPHFFGFRDLSSLNAARTSDWINIERMCEQVISIFEPRVFNVFAKIEEFDNKKQILKMTINATIRLNKINEQIRFPVVLEVA
ncbi:MAG: type VI secretion system baseplate subunit TssE [Alphaproteobacteria bacterium]